jgi:hypothetical protein
LRFPSSRWSYAAKGRQPLQVAQVREVVAELTEKRQYAKKQLTELKTLKRNEEKRHRRLMKSASKLDAKDLMELANIRDIKFGQLAQYCTETGVDASDFCMDTLNGNTRSSSSGTRAVEAPSSVTPPVPRAPLPSTIVSDGPARELAEMARVLG